MFGVFDNNKPASVEGFPQLTKGNGWDTHLFPTFAEAVQYAKDWLGQWDTLPDGWDGKPYNYSGYGDKIEVREV